MHHLPVELLTTIFASLGYTDLVAVTLTNQHWRTVVLNDIRLCQTLFLRRTNQYIPDGDEVLIACKKTSNMLRAHPVFAALRYQFGDGLETAGFIGDNADMRFINELHVSKNFAFIPSVDNVDICIHTDPGYKSMLPVLKVSVSNPCGITVQDVIVSLVEETKRKVDIISYVSGGAFSQRLYGGQRAALAMVAEVLPKKKRYFSQFINMHRTEGSATVELQPSPSPTT